jgi:Ala-tRNA(Pro) deacylase
MTQTRGERKPCFGDRAHRPPADWNAGIRPVMNQTTLGDRGAPPLRRDELFVRLAELGIATTTTEHEAVFTVAESEKLERDLPGGHTKNLFLKDAKDRLFLLVAESHTRVDLKTLPKVIDSARLSFGKPELLLSVLGVTPGSVTAFAVVNDVAGRVTVLIDKALLGHERINCHPLENTATTNIARDDLLRFIRATGHEPRIVDLTALAT